LSINIVVIENKQTKGAKIMKKYIVLDKSQVETQKQYKTALHAFEKFSKDPDNQVMLKIVTNC